MLKNTEALRSSQIFYVFVLRVEIVTIFDPKVVTISARFQTLRHFQFHGISFHGILLLLKCSFWEFGFLTRSKISL